MSAVFQYCTQTQTKTHTHTLFWNQKIKQREREKPTSVKEENKHVKEKDSREETTETCVKAKKQTCVA